MSLEGKEYPFYKDSPDNRVMWVDNYDTVGEHLFSFDGVKVYNLFRDYPHNMTEAEVAIFDSEYPEWAEFFKDRKQEIAPEPLESHGEGF